MGINISDRKETNMDDLAGTETALEPLFILMKIISEWD
jgi:hypothetical protein